MRAAAPGRDRPRSFAVGSVTGAGVLSPLSLSRLGRGRAAVALAFRRDHLLVRTGDGRWVRWRLPSEFVTASPTEPNLASAVEAARAVQSALGVLAPRDSRFGDAVIALPDRAAHAALSGTAGSRASRKLRTELVRGLTASSGPDARDLDGRFRFGTLASGSPGRRSVLGAVTAAAVAQQYESAAEAAGLRVRWVDATSLAVLPEWLAGGRGNGDERLLLLLHRRHFVLAAAAGPRLTGFRMKLRAALDPEPAALAVLGATRGARRPVQVWGDGAESVAEALRSAGHSPRDIRDAGSDAEGSLVSPVTDRALGALLRRVGVRAASLRPTPVQGPQ